MGRLALALLPLLALLLPPPAAPALAAQPRPRTVIKVGYLTAAKGKLMDRQGLSISGAITMALHEINKSPKILPDVKLELSWNDTRGETVVATRAITEMICDGVLAFFGPEESCYVEAIITQSQNLPMISYKCSDYSTSSIPTFARTEPPDLQVTKSVISLLKYYKWHKFSIIHDKRWLTVALSLEIHAKKNNMTVNHLREAMNQHNCCEHHLACCNAAYWYQFIQETKNRTRIYVFLGEPRQLIEFMLAMEAAQLFVKGEYMVITVDMMTYELKEAYKHMWIPEFVNKNLNCNEDQFYKKRLRSLLIIVSTPPVEEYSNFTQRVQEYNAKDPFYFHVPLVLNKYSKFVSIYAAYLYDSVNLYANALDKLLRDAGNLTSGRIREIASNGTNIIAKIHNQTYTSITGASIRLDEQGDSEGNFSVLALQYFAPPFTKNNFTCDHYMLRIGHFQQGSSSEYPTYKPKRSIEWPNNLKPEDEPSCGFLNEHCPKEDTRMSSVIVAITLAVALFCATVVTISIYRKWKIEQEIEGLLWKIDPHDIRGYGCNDMVSSPSKLSLASGGSFESRCGLQIFATTGQFKGNVIRIKELKFSKKKDIPRDVMKEMRLLRDLRHDNINSFIGAVVEPMRVLLVTDYCAKGSLYDIIENEDIKLDNMFIASLVHDLIKGMCFIHSSPLGWHGNLKSSNCVVTSRWMLQVTDFGLQDLRHSAENDSIGEHQYYRSLFWKAPELLRPNGNSGLSRGTQKGDVYAFSIILYEIIGRKGPFGPTPHEPKEIVEYVKRCPSDGEEPFRPDINALQLKKQEDFVLSCMKDCWNEDPDSRPDFHTIRIRLKKMKDGKTRNIMDQMMEMMEKYATNLEDLVNERTRLLYEEKQKTEDLLHRMLPQPVAKRLTTGHGVEPESFDSVTIYFSDIVGFTQMSAESTPLEVVNFLNDLYTVFDRIIKGYDVYKVETIGDAYMVVSGLPIRNDDRHAGEIASMSLDLLDAVKNHRISHRPNETLKLRIGIHTGPVVAGVVGLTMPRYCLFGDTVNTASRMESNGEALKIHISGQCKIALEKLEGYHMQPRGTISIKGKGEVQTYWLVGANEKAIQRRAVDLGELPPLFCRPRRSPKLTDSRQTSVFGNTGLNSRRQSAIRIMEGGSSASLGRSSPKPEPELINYRNRRLLSSIASSAEEKELCLGVRGDIVGSHGGILREAHSLDLSHLQSPQLRKTSRSLNQFTLPILCYPNTTISTLSGNHINNINFINGNAGIGLDANDSPEIAEASPLLRKPSLTGVPEPADLKRHDVNSVSFPSKKWRSLEALGDGEVPETVSKKARMHKWLLGILSAGGFRTSDNSLRKALPLLDKESAV